MENVLIDSNFITCTCDGKGHTIPVNISSTCATSEGNGQIPINELGRQIYTKINTHFNSLQSNDIRPKGIVEDIVFFDLINGLMYTAQSRSQLLEHPELIVMKNILKEESLCYYRELCDNVNKSIVIL